MDWLDLLTVQGTLKSLLQHHSSKASILWHSVFFMVQLLHPYLDVRKTGKTIALTRWTFVGKVMSLLFNMLTSFVIAYLPRRKHLLISWLQSPSAVIMEPKKIKSVTVSILSTSICHEVMQDLSFLNAVLNQLFTLLFHLHQEVPQLLFPVFHKGEVICTSEVINIYPGNLDSSLCFIQCGISHDLLCI